MSSPRTIIAACLCLGLVVAAVAVPVAAHGNTIEVDAQRSPDGTVIAESVFVFEDTWLAVHSDDGGSIGEPIGHTAVAPNELHTEYPVAIDEAVWSEWDGTRTVHLALHHDDGDGEFDPADDEILSSGDVRAITTISLEKADERAYVNAARVDSQETNGSVTVRAARLPADGYLVLQPADGSGNTLGHEPLPAGSHENVTLRIEESFYRQQDQLFDITIAVYRGDGEFGDGDEPLLAGDTPIATTVSMQRTDDRTPAPGTTAEDSHDHEDGEDGHDHEDGEDSHDQEDGEETEAPPTATAGEDGPGFGAVVALLAVTAIGMFAGYRLTVTR